jgi:hypothetical protein
MVQRLVFGGYVQRIHRRRQRFDAFTLERQHQPPAIVLQPHPAVRMTQYARQPLKVVLQFVVHSHDITLTKEDDWVIGSFQLLLTQSD